MAARYELSATARRDLADIRTYYVDAASARVADSVLDELIAAFRFLARTPGAGHRREDLTSRNVRFWPVFSYLIVYDPAAKPLGIARVLHGSRDIAAILLPPPSRG